MSKIEKIKKLAKLASLSVEHMGMMLFYNNRNSNSRSECDSNNCFFHKRPFLSVLCIYLKCKMHDVDGRIRTYTSMDREQTAV